jgi:hypothetical protein
MIKKTLRVINRVRHELFIKQKLFKKKEEN